MWLQCKYQHLECRTNFLDKVMGPLALVEATPKSLGGAGSIRGCQEGVAARVVWGEVLK